MNASNASAAVPMRHQRTRPRWRENDEGGAGGCCWKSWGDGLGNFGVRKLITSEWEIMGCPMICWDCLLFSSMLSTGRIIDDMQICCTIIDIFSRGVGHLLCQTAVPLKYRVLMTTFSHQHAGFLPTSLITGSGKPSWPRVFIATAAGTRRTNHGRRNASDKCAKCRFGKWFFGRSVNMQYVGHDAGPGSFHTKGQASFNCWWHLQPIPYLELQQVHNYDSGPLGIYSSPFRSFRSVRKVAPGWARRNVERSIACHMSDCKEKSADRCPLLPWEFKVNFIAISWWVQLVLIIEFACNIRNHHPFQLAQQDVHFWVSIWSS